MLNNIFTNTAANIDLVSILISLGTSLILGVIIALTHKKTSKYTKNFLITLATLPILVSTVILLVNGNLGTSVAIMGAFSLVRFRSIPGSSKEILSVFFSMVIGLAIGTGYVIYAVLITIIGSLAILMFNKIKLFDKNNGERKLKIVMPEDLDYTSVFDDIFKKYTKESNLEKVKTINMGSLFELTYRIVLKDNKNEKKFIDELRVRNGNLKIVLTQSLEESDL